MKKGIRAHDVAEKGIDNIVKTCQENHIEYIQLVLEKSVENFEFGKFTESYAKQIKEQLNDINVAILGSYINPSNPDKEECQKELAKFKEKIKYASILKPIAVGTETGSYIEGMTDTEEAYLYLLKNLRGLVIEAERYGVDIAIEGVHCFVINTPQKMKRLIEDINSERFKVIFDPLNFLSIETLCEQDKIINDTFELLADRICALHVKDVIVKNGKYRLVRPTEGVINYKLILNKLKEYKLDIPLICEEISLSDAIIAFENIKKSI